MKLLYFIDSLTSGGAQRQAVELARQLHGRDGVTVSFLVYHELDFFGPRLRDAGIAVRCVAKSPGIDLTFPLRLRQAFRGEAPDLIHAFLLHPSAWGVLARSGQRLSHRPVYVSGERSVLGLGRGAFLVERLAFRGADAVTTNAAVVADEILRRHGAPRGGIHYLPNGIDLDDWDAQSMGPSPVAIEPGTFTLALVGGLRAEKNHGLLLAALARIPATQREGWRVLFVGAETGRPRDAERVRATISMHGLGGMVRLTGAVEAVPALLRQIDLLVLPSCFEAFPNVLLEAMASRLPSVATAVGDVPRLIEDGVSGFVIPPGDPEALAKALLRVSSLSRVERRAMGERGRTRIEAEFRIEAVAARYFALYQALLETG